MQIKFSIGHIVWVSNLKNALNVSVNSLYPLIPHDEFKAATKLVDIYRDWLHWVSLKKT